MKGLTNLEILNNEKGRFGNQLFRVATIIGESLKKNCDYYIPNNWEYAKLFPNLKNVIPLKEITSQITSHYTQPNFGFDHIPNTSGILNINGYFQSWKFFEGFENEIISSFTFSNELVEKALVKLSKDTVKICVHLRWGDVYDRLVGGGYKENQDKYTIMSLHYYEEAIKYILTETKVDEILVFTDNKDTKEFITGNFEKFGVKVLYFDYSDDFVTDFICQSLCDHFIIANSTFSWWSSFLSKSENKIVCCPKEDEWFGPSYKHLNTSNLLPINWKKISQN
jgi:Glycosyl transferase family 11